MGGGSRTIVGGRSSTRGGDVERRSYDTCWLPSAYLLVNKFGRESSLPQLALSREIVPSTCEGGIGRGGSGTER